MPLDFVKVLFKSVGAAVPTYFNLTDFNMHYIGINSESALRAYLKLIRAFSVNLVPMGHAHELS